MTKPTYFDLLATLGVESAHPGGFALTKEIIDRERITQATRVLDIGCGTGQTACYLAKKYGCQVTALDLHPTMLKKAQKRCRKAGVSIRFIQANAEQLPFKRASFDLLIVESVSIFTTIANSLPEYKRVLKKGGILLDQEMTAERYLYPMQHQEISSFYGLQQIPSEQEWLQHFATSGFQKVEIAKKATLHSIITTPVPEENYHLNTNRLLQLSPELQSILYKHYQLIHQYSHHLGYRFFRAIA